MPSSHSSMCEARPTQTPQPLAVPLALHDRRPCSSLLLSPAVLCPACLPATVPKERSSERAREKEGGGEGARERGWLGGCSTASQRHCSPASHACKCIPRASRAFGRRASRPLPPTPWSSPRPPDRAKPPRLHRGLGGFGAGITWSTAEPCLAGTSRRSGHSPLRLRGWSIWCAPAAALTKNGSSTPPTCATGVACSAPHVWTVGQALRSSLELRRSPTQPTAPSVVGRCLLHLRCSTWGATAPFTHGRFACCPYCLLLTPSHGCSMNQEVRPPTSRWSQTPWESHESVRWVNSRPWGAVCTGFRSAGPILRDVQGAAQHSTGQHLSMGSTHIPTRVTWMINSFLKP